MKWFHWFDFYARGRASVLRQLRDVSGPMMVAATSQQAEAAAQRLGSTGGGTVVFVGTIHFPMTGTGINIGKERNENAGINLVADKIENLVLIGLHVKGFDDSLLEDK